MSFHQIVSPTEEIIAEARAGRMVVLVDDEDRENEGDLVIAAEMASVEAVNFMAKHGRGLICLALTGARIDRLGLKPMAQDNAARMQTAFTASIEAREGVTTGISARDRAHTIAVAIDPACGAQDIVSPGHVFPLRARDGGVLERSGHTEAAVDIARLAGLNPAGVICEIMNDDGTMARRDDLVAFAQFHGLKIGTIADLIAYRRRTERLVECRVEREIGTLFGGPFRLRLYVNRLNGSEHLALVMGDITAGGPVLVRMHSANIFEDMLGAGRRDHLGLLQRAMEAISREGRGVIVVIRERAQGGLAQLIEQWDGKKEPAPVLREYGTGAQILLDLGIRQLILMSNSHQTVAALDGFGLDIVGHRPIPKFERPTEPRTLP